MKDFSITTHAIERFMVRVCPETDDIKDARSALAVCARSSRKLSEVTNDGEELWESTEPPCLLVVRRPPGAVVPVLVTVYGDDLAAVPSHVRDAAEKLLQIARRHALATGAPWLPPGPEVDAVLCELVLSVVEPIYARYFARAERLVADKTLLADRQAKTEAEYTARAEAQARAAEKNAEAAEANRKKAAHQATIAVAKAQAAQASLEAIQAANAAKSAELSELREENARLKARLAKYDKRGKRNAEEAA